MQDDNDLRARFRTLASEDAAGAPVYSRPTVIGTSVRRRSASRRLLVAAAWAAGVVVALAIGLVWGANTGYASARVESDQRQSEMTASTLGVTSQIAALRLDLSRARSDLARRSLETGTLSRQSIAAADAELRAMESSAERIELDLTQSPLVGAPGGTIHTANMPMKRALAITCSALALGAQTPPVDQSIPIIELPAASVKSNLTIGAVSGLRQLSSGNVLVNDSRRRQMLLFDSTLATSKVARDSMSGSATSYGPTPATLIPFRGDSTLFVDLDSRSLLVFDAAARSTRAWALPSDPDALIALIGMPSAVDNRGRLLYLSGRQAQVNANRDTTSHDSLVVVRADLDARRLDTVGRLNRPTPGRPKNVPARDGKSMLVVVVNPLQFVDDWAVLSDGTIALVRGHDYHVDWIRPDGTKSATAKLPFDWKRLSDDDKQKLVDSARAARAVMVAKRAADAGGRGNNDPLGAVKRDDASGRGGADGAAPLTIEYVTLGEIADYYPPVRANTSLADLDGNLWLLPTTSAQSKNGELVYDIVNPQRGLVERVRIPLGRAVVGFAKGGVVYLRSGDVASGFYLERTRLPRPK